MEWLLSATTNGDWDAVRIQAASLPHYEQTPKRKQHELVSASLRRILRTQTPTSRCAPPDILPLLFSVRRDLSPNAYHPNAIGKNGYASRMLHELCSVNDDFESQQFANQWPKILYDMPLSTLNAILEEYFHGCSRTSRSRPKVVDVCYIFVALLHFYFHGCPTSTQIFDTIKINKFVGAKDYDASTNRTSMDEELLTVWRKVKRFIFYCRDFNLAGETFALKEVLHTFVKWNCPNAVLWLICKIRPESLTSRDNRGCLPLHYTGYHHCVLGFDNYHLLPNIPIVNGEDGKMTKTQLLVELFPGGAAYADRDGLLPLNKYLSKEGCRYNATIDRLPETLSDLRVLAKAAPQALATKIPRIHIYPFMLASMGLSLEEFFISHRNCKAIDISCTYELLRADPSIVDRPISGFEVSLQQQLDKLNKTLEASDARADDLDRMMRELEAENWSLKRRLSAYEENSDASCRKKWS